MRQKKRERKRKKEKVSLSNDKTVGGPKTMWEYFFGMAARILPGNEEKNSGQGPVSISLAPSVQTNTDEHQPGNDIEGFSGPNSSIGE